MFAAVDLPAGSRIIDYVGAVCLGANEDRESDYVCDFGENSEFALDSRHVGNEARFINDYRNTGRHANVEFRLRRDSRGEMRQGVFVNSKHGIHKGSELLISCKPVLHARHNSVAWSANCMGDLAPVRLCLLRPTKRAEPRLSGGTPPPLFPNSLPACHVSKLHACCVHADGKSYWRSRVGNLDEFIHTRPEKREAST